MKIKHKKSGAIGYSREFNTHAVSEILVGFEDDGGYDTDYLSNYDVWIEATQEWKDLRQAFKDRDIITDNYNTRFFEPGNEEDRKRGYTL